MMATERIKSLMAQGKIGAITLDFSIFEQHAFKFETGLLEKMSQFPTRNIRFILPDIVLSEIQVSVYERTVRAKDKLLKHVLKANDLGIIDNQTINLLQNSSFKILGYLEVIQSRIDAFCQNTELELIPTDGPVELVTLYSHYNSLKATLPPKNRSIDELFYAISWHALKQWTETNGQYLIVIGDSFRCKQFCNVHDKLLYVNNLPEALSYFQQNTPAHLVCQNFIDSYNHEKTGKALSDAIKKLLDDELFELFLEIKNKLNEGNLFDIVSLVILDFYLERGDDIPKPVHYSKNKVIFSTTVFAYLALAVDNFYDQPFDETCDFLPWDSGELETAKEFELECLITLEGDFETNQKNFSVASVEIINYHYSLDIELIRQFYLNGSGTTP